MAKAKRKKQVDAVQIETPTPEQIGTGEFQRVGMHYRRVPVIEVLYDKGVLNQREYEALDYYGAQASLADKSPVRSCCDTSPRGGSGPGVAITSALIETGRLERELGVLRDIARAIAVDNWTLEQWCIAKHGGRECYDKKGKFVAMVPVNESENMGIATLELRMAARRMMGV